MDFADAKHFAEIQNKFVQVPNIDGFDDEIDDGVAVGCGLGIDLADVGAVVGDDDGERKLLKLLG